MENPFFENGRFISPSLNRLRIVDLPGFAPVAPYRNRTGYDLLSRHALHQLIAENSTALQLEPDVSLHRFDACFESDDKVVCATAVAIAEEFGRRLGIVLLTLKRGDGINRAARPSWDARHWSLWANIDTVYVGGGLVAGYLGPIAAQTAQNLVRGIGYLNYNVERSENAAHLPLFGLTRLASANTKALLVVDFGHTAVKRGVAIFDEGKCETLDMLPSLLVDHQVGQPVALSETAVATFAEWVLSVLLASWQEACAKKQPLVPMIGVSMACYLRNGQPPAAEMGYYGRLQLLSDNVQMLLSDRLSLRLGQSVQIHLIHDATAAALTISETQGSAVLMFGTAVGNAFPAFNIL